MSDIVIVGADAHVNPPTETWTDYLPEEILAGVPEDERKLILRGRARQVFKLA